MPIKRTCSAIDNCQEAIPKKAVHCEDIPLPSQVIFLEWFLPINIYFNIYLKKQLIFFHWTSNFSQGIHGMLAPSPQPPLPRGPRCREAWETSRLRQPRPLVSPKSKRHTLAKCCLQGHLGCFGYIFFGGKIYIVDVKLSNCTPFLNASLVVSQSLGVARKLTFSMLAI